MNRPVRYCRSAQLVVAAVAFLALAAVGLASTRATMTAPRSAIVGGLIRVTASHLKPGQYSLTLFARRAPSKNDFCQGRLATAARPATSVSFTARIPRRLPCYSGFPGSSRGSIKVTAGTYSLIVAVRQGTSFFGSYSYLKRALKVT